MTDIVITSAVALTIGLVWALRQTGLIADRFLPILSLVVGAGWAWVLGAAGGDIAVEGVKVGLMAAGAWSGGKTLIQG